jgi:hypothetical protein
MAKQKKTEAVDIPGVPQDLVNVLALLDGREPTNDDRLQIADGTKVADILPVTTRIAKKANGGDSTNLGTSGLAGAFNNAAGNIDPSTLQIGQLVGGKGIYIGEWKPTDSNGRSLNKTFDLYAAPEDIRQDNGDNLLMTFNNLLMTFNNAVKHVAGLQNWHGHNGGDLKNEKAVMKAVRNNPEALGSWFIPTKEMLHGRNTNGDTVQNDNLYAHREKMPSGGEFVITDNGSGNARWYWSCTERPGNSSYVYVVNFRYGYGHWNPKDTKLSVRPVRAELRPS